AHAQDALRLAEELRQPQTLAVTLWFVSWLQYQRGERIAGAETAQRLLGVIDAYGFVPWSDVTIVVPPAVDAARLDPAGTGRAAPTAHAHPHGGMATGIRALRPRRDGSRGRAPRGGAARPGLHRRDDSRSVPGL